MKPPLFWLVLVCVASAPAWAVQCGDILGPGGTYTLTADLDCCVTDETPITLIDGATLDLQGFTLTAVLTLDGQGTTLRNGHVAQCRTLTRGIAVGGSGGHRLDGVSVGYIGSGDGVVIGSDGNSLHRVQASADTAIVLTGNRNVIRESVFSFVYYGLWVRGHQNRIVRSRTEQIIDIGFFVEGEGNLFLRNTSTTAGTIDAVDTHGDCVHNRWLFNTFATADPPCLLEFPRSLGATTVSEAR